jgi:hypothetical protein
MRFGAQVANVFNHPNFAVPGNLTVGVPGFGQITSLQSAEGENIVKDPRYLNTTFVLIHGGYPYFREVIWLASMKNVYIDTSEIETLVYPSELKNVLKLWLETYPEKITFGLTRTPLARR